MKTQTEEAYKKVFLVCKVLFGVKTMFVISDLEKKLVNAIGSSFATNTQKLCNFHMSQAIGENCRH
jgi:transposase-like protein